MAEMTTPISTPGLFVTDDMHALIAVWNAAPGVTLRLSGVIVDLLGRPQKFQQDVIPPTDRSFATLVVPLTTGWIPSMDVRAVVGTPRRGQCFVRVSLIAGVTANATSLGTIMQGYVQDTTVLAYPGSPVQTSIDGPGVIRSITGTNPAPGAEIAEAVPTNARWRLQAIRLTLTASAAAANRVPVLTIDDGATVLFETGSAVVVTASQVATYVAAPGAPFFTLGTRSYQLPLPSGLVLQGGSRIRTVTGAIDAGDDYAAPQLLVEEWIED